MAFVRVHHDSPVFGAKAGDIVDVATEVAEVLLDLKAATAVPAQQYTGMPKRPDSLAVNFDAPNKGNVVKLGDRRG